jgi:lipopolysaccharide biosynthesis regulator YciM
MELDLTWLLWGLPLAFALGWVASRLDLRQWRIAGRHAPRAYFRGLNHLLNEQQDQAIDAFIEAVQSDPDTAELHFALGNLFRRRGDYDRAIRVHEHLLARSDIGRKDRERAQHALALDFLKAGLLDRAEAALLKLEGSAFESEALLALLSIYERTRDWPQARCVAEKLDRAEPGAFAGRLAHYLCEEAELAQREGNTLQAFKLLDEAVARVPSLARGWMAIATLRLQIGDASGAFEALLNLADKAPQALPLAAPRLAELARQLGREPQAFKLLEAAHARAPSLDVSEALAALAPSTDEQRRRYLEHLRVEPSLVMATRWLEGEAFSDPTAREPVMAALEQACGPLKRYRCAACGFEARQHFWQCPGCQAWDSYPARRVEEL